jgi:hypothetical protein
MEADVTGDVSGKASRENREDGQPRNYGFLAAATSVQIDTPVITEKGC